MLREPIDLPPIVSVELIQITDKTNIPYAPKARKIIEDTKKKEDKRVVSEQAPQEAKAKEKPDRIPLPNEKKDEKKIVKKKQNPEEIKPEIRQSSEFEKKEIIDTNQIAALIDKAKEVEAVKKETKQAFRLPKSIYVILFIFIFGLFGFNQLIKNDLYGSKCVAAAEEEKKSNFSDQLKLLQKNAESVDEEALEGGELGGNKDYGDIFGDTNLFKDFGGFDTKEED